MIRWWVALIPYVTALGVAVGMAPAAEPTALLEWDPPDPAPVTAGAPEPLAPARLGQGSEIDKWEQELKEEWEEAAAGAAPRAHESSARAKPALAASDARVAGVVDAVAKKNRELVPRAGPTGRKWLQRHAGWVRAVWACCPDVRESVMIDWLAALQIVATDTQTERRRRAAQGSAPVWTDRCFERSRRDYGERLGSVTGAYLFDTLRADERERFLKLRPSSFGPFRSLRRRPPMSVREAQDAHHEFKKRVRQYQERERREYVEANPNLPAAVRTAIQAGEIVIGMRWEAIELSRYDERARVDRNGDVFSVSLYRPGEPDLLVVSFNDGVVTGVTRRPRTR